MFDEMVRTIDAVRHVLNSKRNLISLSILDLKEYMHTVEDGVVKVSKGAHILLNEYTKSQLFVLLCYTKSLIN